jgi:hypothetical protein
MPDCSVLSAGGPATVNIAQEHGLSGAAVGCGPYERPASNSTVPALGRPPGDRTIAVSPAHRAAAEKVVRSFNTWAFKREQPADPQLLQQVVAESISLGEPVSFVLYWGKGSRSGLAEPEIQCFEYLGSLANRVRQAHAPGAAIKLIFTDTHARLNGHSAERISAYFAEVEAAARHRGFDCCWLSEITHAADVSVVPDPNDEIMPEDTFLRLSASAQKWYRGNGTVEQGALNYYQMNMVEKRAVELAFPRSVFVTFSGSELRSLFPKHLPIFYMYSIKRGVSSKPWFLASEAMPPKLVFDAAS